MPKIARDSGISVDNDNDDSLSSATSSSRENNQLSYVQRLRKRFECLAKEQEKEFHDEVNWWLHEESEVNEQRESKTTDADDKPNDIFIRTPSIENDVKSYSKQSSIKSQISRDSSHSRAEVKLLITPSTPVKSPSTPKEFPGVTLIDFQENNETNDSDSFDSATEEENEVFEEKVEEIADHKYFRQTSTVSRLARPASVTSQTSK